MRRVAMTLLCSFALARAMPAAAQPTRRQVVHPASTLDDGRTIALIARNVPALRGRPTLRDEP